MIVRTMFITRTVAIIHEHRTTPLIQARLLGALEGELFDSAFVVLLDSHVGNVKFESRLGFSFASGSSVRLKLNIIAVGQWSVKLYCSQR